MSRVALFAAAILFALTSIAVAGDVHVNGYMRKDGTYVQPYYRTAPDSNPYNNYSTKGNVNPYTGKEGTVIPQNRGYGGYGAAPSPETPAPNPYAVPQYSAPGE